MLNETDPDSSAVTDFLCRYCEYEKAEEPERTRKSSSRKIPGRQEAGIVVTSRYLRRRTYCGYLLRCEIGRALTAGDSHPSGEERYRRDA